MQTSLEVLILCLLKGFNEKQAQSVMLPCYEEVNFRFNRVVLDEEGVYY